MKNKIIFNAKLIYLSSLLIFSTVFSFAQSDLQTAIKGGKLLLSGLSIIKTSKAENKSDRKVIESICVKNKLADSADLQICAIWY